MSGESEELQSIPTSVPTDIGETCAFCLEAVLLRGGGIPLHSPGCCGKLFHQKCIIEYVSTGLHSSTAKCPSCRSSFDVPPWMRSLQSTVTVNPPPPPPSFPRLNFGGIPTRRNTSNAFIGDSVEELLPDVLNAASDVSAARAQNIADLQSSISISSTPEYNVIGLGAKDAFYVRVGIQYQERLNAGVSINGTVLTDPPEVENPTFGVAFAAKDANIPPPSTVALDIVCVLDNSGSMTGAKLSSLKSAMNFVIQSLGPNDRLAVCFFNHHADNLHGLLRMNDEKKTKSANIIRDHLNAGGGTNILSGMKRGAEILQTRQTRNTASCLFLLTDGQDRSNKEEKIELARELKDSGTALFVFGFGADHDAEHMMEIAQAAEGGFSYIDTDDTVADAFGGALGSLQGSILLTNLTLRLSSSAHDVQINSASAGRYSTSVDASKTLATVSIANMFCGEKRDVLLQVSVPQVPHPCFSPLLSASLQYSAFGEAYSYPPSTSSTAAGGITCGVERVDDSDERLRSQTRALEVDEQINRLTVTAATRSAMAAADRGDMTEARRILLEAISVVTSSPSLAANSAQATGLLQELRDALDSTVTRENYHQRGGKNAMCETYSSTMQQRSTYTKLGKVNLYQSTSSVSNQDEFKRKKDGL